MARILLQGLKHTAEITFDELDGQVFVACLGAQAPHSDVYTECRYGWTERYDDLRDATEYAADHVDGGR